MGSGVKEMVGATQRKPPRLSVELFRGFVESRPDEERWELIDGVAVMVAPPTLAHQRIAGNLYVLLHTALARHAPALAVYMRAGLNLAPPVEDYDPEPDLVVIDEDASKRPGERYADQFYLVAEVVSASDIKWSEKKREIYKLHEACTCILTEQQDRIEVSVDLRASSGWTETMLTSAEDLLDLADFGLRCKVSELYRGTLLET